MVEELEQLNLWRCDIDVETVELEGVKVVEESYW